MKRLSVVVAVFSVLTLLLGYACQRVSTPTPAPTQAPTTNSVAESQKEAKVIGIPPAGQIYHAVFPLPAGISEEDGITLNSLRSYEQYVGKPVAWVYFSHNWYKGRSFPIETATWIRDAGSVPFIRLMLRSSEEQNVTEATFTLRRILEGEFDDDLRAWAQAARDFGFPLLVEYGTEVNGEWFSWNGIWNGGGRLDGYDDRSLPDGPERFRDAYRRIIRIMREEGAYNILWVFHVNNEDIPNESWNRLEQYYPGDEWIDWIGVSVYGAPTPMDEEWSQFRDLMDQVYPRLASLSPKKPIVLLEFGVTSGNSRGDQAAWAESALSDLTAFHWPQVIGFSWWNEAWSNDDNPAHDTNMRVQDNPALAKVFQRLVGMQDNVLGKPVLTDRVISSQTPLAPSNIAQVWANEGGNKVTRDELWATKDPNAVRNSVWDSTGLSLFGARNEVVSFNMVLEAPTSSATNVNLTLTSLTGPGGASITTKTATGDSVFNFVGRNIELFYVRYLEIKGLSTSLFYDHYDERHIPARLRRPYHADGLGSGSWTDRPGHSKLYPEIAVPLELSSPFTITAGNNQSIWGDIYIPQTVPAGHYTGTISVTENGVSTWQIPIRLRVRNFTLPDLPNAKTMVPFSPENINDRYLGEADPEPGTAVYTQSLVLTDRHFQLAHRHKISLIDTYTPVERMDDAWVSRLNGVLFTPARNYAGIGTGVGNNVYSIGTYGSWPWQGGTQAQMWANTDAWVRWFESKAFTTPTDYFLYLIDESDDYPLIEQWAQWINTNPGPGQRLISLATIPLPTAVAETPSLDIPTSWAPVGITNVWQNAANRYIADPNKRVYLYNSNRPATGSFAIEDDGVALRVLAWAQYKKGIDRWFYWESTYYNDFQGGGGHTNVFQKAQTFGGGGQFDNSLGETGWNYLNGDGVLFYPGTDTRYPADSYGVQGPFASLRLKHWRRGIQDVDYLTLAAAINPARTAEIVNTMIPKVLWEYGVSDPNDPTWVRTDISWSIDPDVWEAARAELADIIERSAQDGDTPPSKR